MINNFKRIIVIIMLAVILLNANFYIISIASQKTDAYLIKTGTAPKHLTYFRDETGQYTYVTCSIVGCKEGENFYPAYCMDRQLPGAETKEYTVNLDLINKNTTINRNGRIIDSSSIWRVVKNGYPYKTPEEMGLETMEDAFAVTKFAIYCILGEAELEKYSYTDGDTTGEIMLNALRNLVDIGLNGTENLKDSFFKIEKLGEIYKENNKYFQNYKIQNLIETRENYNIEIINNNNLTVEKIDNTSFRVAIPDELMSNNIDIEFSIEKEVKNYPVFYGKTTVSGTQDYIVTFEKFSNVKENFKSDIQTNNSQIIINKIDSENGKPIANTKFELKEKNGNIIEKKTSDENGKIVFENLYKGKYILKEVQANDLYIINNDEIEVELDYEENKVIEIKNNHKKGNIKIIKFDKDNKKITLGGIEFNLLNEKNEYIQKYTTDLNGEIFINSINIGKYCLQEVLPKNGYDLPESIEFEVLENETTEIEIGNEKTKGKIKVIKIDKENSEIKLSGVEFAILDENKKEIERIITDENGEAISSNLPIYNEKYYLKEVKTDSNYILDEEEKEIVLNPHVIENIVIENEIKKGRIKLKKVDYDTFEPISNVKFKVFDKKTNQLIETIETNEKGEAYTSYLPINKEYKIIEAEKLEGYIENKDEILFAPEWNKLKEITITNKKEVIEVKVIPDVPDEEEPVNEVEIKTLPKTGY